MKRKTKLLSVLLVLSVAFLKSAWGKDLKATFAGGCFWCMEPPFEKLKGVKSVTAGFAGGTLKKPSYKLVSSGKTNHIEAVQIVFDSQKVGYKKLLNIFWKNINPTDSGGQFVDRGKQYTTAIFYHSLEQKNLAEESKKKIAKKFSKKIVTPIRRFTTFYKAEDYHQDYYKKNPFRYKFYRYRSGRDDFLEKQWSKKK